MTEPSNHSSSYGKGVTHTTETFGMCPACGKSLTGQLYWKVEVAPYEGPPVKSERTATLHATGLRLTHDCTTTTTR